ncbi:MAG: hypothetical protein ACOY35_11610 [Bacillota bacterium]
MEFVTKEQIDQFHLRFKDKRIVDITELLVAFQEVFNYPIPPYTLFEDDRKNKITEALFMHPKVIQDLRKSTERNEYIEDEEEILRRIGEVRNGEKKI